jgi:hypothetical protein
MLRKIISGGQTGADQGGLEAARSLGLETGGKAPLGFKTEDGPRPALGPMYGLEELASDEYPPRTRYNVVDSDATVIFGRTSETGSRMTRRMCKESHKPCLVIEEFDENSLELLRSFVTMYEVETLNVAGNRESKNYGIQRKVRNYLVEALGDAVGFFDEFPERS